MKRYSLTAEHKRILAPWLELWRCNAVRTDALDGVEKTAIRSAVRVLCGGSLFGGSVCEDKASMRAAVRGMYVAAELTPPPPERIVFVRGPVELRVAGGFAAYFWETGRARSLAGFEPRCEAYREVISAVSAAIGGEPVGIPTMASARDLIASACKGLTCAAIRAATEPETYEAVRKAATDPPIVVNSSKIDYDGAAWRDLAIAMFGEEHAERACLLAANTGLLREYGNESSHYAAYSSFFRHVAKLDIDWSKWSHWEAAAVHGGPRIMHKEFCLISDRPEVVQEDLVRWRDGSELRPSLNGKKAGRPSGKSDAPTGDLDRSTV